MKTHKANIGSGQDMLGTALALFAMGLAPVLLKAGDKMPVFNTYLHWQHGIATPADMELPLHKQPYYLTEQIITHWFEAYPGANLGVLTRDIHAVDVDEPEVWSTIAPLLPTTPLWKRGRPDRFSLLYRPSTTDPILRTRTFRSRLNKEHMLLEVLAGGRQTVLPPSMHPDTGQPYRWDGPALGEVLPGDLPELTQAKVLEIEEALIRASYLQTRLTAARADDAGYYANRDRYAQWFAVKLADKIEQVTHAQEGGRQQALNDALFSLAAGVRVGALSEADLESAMRRACEVNGFYAERGEKLWFRDFRRGLDEGAETVELPDLGERTGPNPLLSAAEVFAGRPAPEEPVRPLVEVPTVTLADAGEFMAEPAPARRWCVLDVIPAAQISMIYGEPGKGKTTLLMQLAIQASRGGQFFGKPVAKHKRVLFIVAEDDRAEVHHRMAEICRSYGLAKADVLFLIMDEQEAEITDLSRVVGDRSIPTPMMDVVEGIVRDHGVDLLLIDPVGDVFGGNENDKLQVRSFMQMIRRRLCVKHGTTVVFAAHPSRGSARQGDGQAGSTAWSGSARARLFFEEVDDNGTMRLSLQKANRSAKWEASMRWVKGAFEGYAPGADDRPHPCQDAILEEIRKAPCVYQWNHTPNGWVGDVFDRCTGKLHNTKEGKQEVKKWLLEWERKGFICRTSRTNASKNKRDHVDIPQVEVA